MKNRISSKEVAATMEFYKSLYSESTIIPLPIQFIGSGEVKGFIFTQVASTERAYMYKVTQGDSKAWFEVVMRKTTPLLINFEKRIYSESEFKEIYPKSHMFGIYAWTYRKIEDARKKLELI